MVQWRNAGVKPPGEAARRRDRRPVFRRCATWSRTRRSRRTRSSRRPSGTTPRPRTCCRRSTARPARHPGEGSQGRRPRRKVSDLSSDGSTSSGCWMYAGVFGGGKNLTKRRDMSDPSGLGLYPNYAWTWPNNTRILYNRASCDEEGKPIPRAKPIVWWDEQAKRGRATTCPTCPSRPTGPTRPRARGAFRQSAEGVGRLFAAVYEDPYPRKTTTGATSRTCRRTARCRSSTSPSRARSRTRCTRARRATRAQVPARRSRCSPSAPSTSSPTC